MRSRILPLLGLLLAPALLAFLVPAGAAQAYSITTIRNLQTGGCLTDAEFSTPRNFTCNLSGVYQNQYWVISGYDSAGRYYNIRNRDSGRCLDYYPGHLTLNADCWNASSPYRDYQSWHFSGTGTRGVYTIQAKLRTPCLYSTSADDQQVTAMPCASSGSTRNAELWLANLP